MGLWQFDSCNSCVIDSWSNLNHLQLLKEEIVISSLLIFVACFWKSLLFCRVIENLSKYHCKPFKIHYAENLLIFFSILELSFVKQRKSTREKTKTCTYELHCLQKIYFRLFSFYEFISNLIFLFLFFKIQKK